MSNDSGKTSSWKKDFSERLRKFGVRIIWLMDTMPKTPAGFSLASQVIRSSTSIGANFIEAQDASSYRDFSHKLSISLREAKETVYWLQILRDVNLLQRNALEDIIAECNEISAILVTSVKSSKNKNI